MNTSTLIQLPLPLEEAPADHRTFLNPSVWFVDAEGFRVVFCRHEPLYRVALNDRVHLRLVAVSLRQSQLATQEEIARTFGHRVVTQIRWERKYEREGIEGLQVKRPTGRPRGLDKSQEHFVRRWFAQGWSNCRMAKQLGVGETTIRRTLQRLGLKRELGPPCPCLPGLEQEAREAESVETPTVDVEMDAEEGAKEACLPDVVSEEVPEAMSVPVALDEPPTPRSFTLDRDPRDRSGDRMLAQQGLLEDALPLFADHEALPRAGALLAVPLLVRHGLIETFAEVYGSLGPSFYGLRTTVVTLFLAALLRIKRPEQFKEHRPEDLGAVLGLDRAPEVKTVRRKFTRLAQVGRGKPLMEALAKRRIAEEAERVAFLYVDGHVREYHGKFPLFEAKKAQRQVVTPAATDTWVHDAHGEPLLVVTSQINAKLTQVLEPVLADVRRVVEDGRRITVAFDRGGFSPKLFARLIASGFDVLTYRKGKVRKLPEGRFAARREEIDGAWREYQVCDRPRVRVGVLPAEGDRKRGGRRKRHLWMREVRVLRDGGRQTPVLTNRQENYFKYAEEEFALDALVEYGAEEVDEGTDRRNPRWLRLTRQLKEARAEAARLEGDLGREVLANEEATRPTIRGFKIAHAGLGRQLEAVRTRIGRLLTQRKKVPARVPAADRMALKTEKKLIADAIKMAAYQVETELLGMLAGQYARSAEEGRTLLHAAFQSPARLEVAGQELRVTLASQSSPHRTAALAALCEQLDALPLPFPGTHLRLRLAVQPAEPIIS